MPEFRRLTGTVADMTPPKPPRSSLHLMNRPYLLLCLTMLFWAGNIVVGRYAAVVTVSDGRVARVVEYPHLAGALAAVGLEEADA